jgi:molybdopterin biosynthesis enzyme
VTIEEATVKGKYIVRKGAEIKKGKRLFRPGELIDERMIASLAAFGYPNVTCRDGAESFDPRDGF